MHAFKLTTLLLTALLVCAQPQAQMRPPTKLATCAEIAENGLRLRCYDKLAHTLQRQSDSLDNGETSPEDSGNWGLSVEQSPIDSRDNSSLSLQAQLPVKSRTQTVTPELRLSCIDGVSKVVVSWSVYLGKNSTKVLSKFDRADPSTIKWLINDDDKQTVFYRGDSIDYVRQLIKHRDLAIQITPYNAPPVVASFDISKLADTLAPLNLSCQW
jgi:type VI secretion system protein VasI